MSTTDDQTGWWAELDEEDGSPMAGLWRPTLSLEGVCVSLDMGFQSEVDCEEFIRGDVLGQGMLGEPETYVPVCQP